MEDKKIEETKEKQDKILNIYEKLLEIRKTVEVLKKANSGDGIKYKYVNEEQILLAIKNKMNELKLLLIPSIKKDSIQSKDFSYVNGSGKDKKEVITQADMTYKWIDIETKEELTTEWGLFGQNASASQSFGSGLTYANKYYLLKFFNIATTDDDPDKLIQEQEAKEERKIMSSNQTKVKKLYTKMLKTYQTQDNILKKLGLTKDQFNNKNKDSELIKSLIEQMELVINDNK